MINEQFKPTIGDAFSDGMNLFKKAGGPMIGYWFLFLILMYVPMIFVVIVGSLIFKAGVTTIVIFGFLMVVLYTYYIVSLWSGFTLYMNGVYRKGYESFGTFFKGFSYGFNVMGSYLLRYIITLPITAISFYLMREYYAELFKVISENPSNFQSLNAIKPNLTAQLISTVFGVFFWFIFMFSMDLILVAKTSIIDSIKYSAQAVWKHFGVLFLLILILVLMNFAGAICLVLGLIFTVPLSMCILHVVYQKTFANEESELSKEIDAFGNSQEVF
jgi:hypothetical protein